MVLRFITSGESHGKGLIGIVEQMPAGVEIGEEDINRELQRRQKGYGRGGRMKIESDRVEVFSGIRNGYSLGSPIAYLIRNQDFENWQEIMAAGECKRHEEKVLNRPRPGHADLAGAMKYNQADMRNILERASAHETAARVAAGAIFKKLLESFDIRVYSQVKSIGPVQAKTWQVNEQNWQDLLEKVDESPLHLVDTEKESLMMEAIDQARAKGESLGGSFEVGVIGMPPGLGSHTSWESRLDSQISALLMSIPAIKAVEIGEGIANSAKPGSRVHDEIFYNEEEGLHRKSNRAGGIEGGISNGETVWARAYMKPIPTLYKPLTSVNTKSWQEEKADIERSDICAVPAAAIVGESMLAFVIARAFLEKFSGDSLDEIRKSYSVYQAYLKRVWKWEKI